jgi:exonuclease SbcC
MLLIVENFRCWQGTHTFHFPDKGLTLLSGKSGSGKSSLLNAIYFALYGVGTKIATNGQKRCRVELTIKNLTVTRTKNPGRLTVEKNGKLYEDDVAQSVIESVFGRDFTVTSYITQKSAESFIQMTASEKMNFLERLAIGDQDIEPIKRKAREYCKTVKDEANRKTGARELVQNQISQLVRSPAPEISYVYSDEVLANYKRDLSLTQNALHQSQSSLRELGYELQTLRANTIQMARWEKTRDEAISTRDECLLRVQTLEKKWEGEDNLQALQEVYDYLSDNEKYIALKTEYQRELEEYQKLQREEQTRKSQEIERLTQKLETLDISDLDDIIQRYQQSIQTRDLYNSIQNKIGECKSKISDLQSQLKSFVHREASPEGILKSPCDSLQFLKSQISEYTATLAELRERMQYRLCPHCSGSVVLINNVLHPAKSQPVGSQDEISKVEAKLKNANSDLAKVSRLKDCLQRETDRLHDLQVQIDSLEIIDDIETITAKLPILKSQQRERDLTQQTLEITRSTHSKTLDSIKRGLDLKNRQLQTLETKVKQSEVETDYTRDEVYREILSQQQYQRESVLANRDYSSATSRLSGIETEIARLRQKMPHTEDYYTGLIQSTEQKIGEHTDKITRLKNWITQGEEYQRWQSQESVYIQWNRQLDSLISEETTCRNRVVVADTFIKRITDAESIAVSQTIDQINYYMNLYLERFFPDNPISVEIMPFKETKKDIKPVVNFRVYYRGAECDLTSLSGGEYDRVVLSVLLALNTIFGSDLLMLDESISSLDSDLSNEILEVLSETLSDKLVVIVAHQIETGVFDTVIDLETV